MWGTPTCLLLLQSYNNMGTMSRCTGVAGPLLCPSPWPAVRVLGWLLPHPSVLGYSRILSSTPQSHGAALGPVIPWGSLKRDRTRVPCPSKLQRVWFQVPTSGRCGVAPECGAGQPAGSPVLQPRCAHHPLRHRHWARGWSLCCAGKVAPSPARLWSHHTCHIGVTPSTTQLGRSGLSLLTCHSEDLLWLLGGQLQSRVLGVVAWQKN